MGECFSIPRAVQVRRVIDRGGGKKINKPTKIGKNARVWEKINKANMSFTRFPARTTSSWFDNSEY